MLQCISHILDKFKLRKGGCQLLFGNPNCDAALGRPVVLEVQQRNKRIPREALRSRVGQKRGYVRLND